MGALIPEQVPTKVGLIEVAETGQGPVVLVIHGTPGDWRQGRTVAEDLASSARVLLVSRPGYGRTPLSSGRTTQQQADLYAALLDSYGLDRAVVLGISGGGPSSYAFAAAHPLRCQALLLCCALAPHLMAPPAAMRRLAAVPGLWCALAAMTRLAARHSKENPPDLSGLTSVESALAFEPDVLRDLWRFAAERPHTIYGAGLRNDTLQLAAGRELNWPAAAVVPTVVLHGAADVVVPVSHAEAFASAVPGARLDVLTGLGHALPLFARSHVSGLLRELLAL